MGELITDGKTFTQFCCERLECQYMSGAMDVTPVINKGQWAVQIEYCPTVPITEIRAECPFCKTVPKIVMPKEQSTLYCADARGIDA